MNIEQNSKILIEFDPAPNVLITPCITPECWLFRVKLSEKQAIVCFPKFGTIGIGFQHEEDWNTNLHYTADAREIFEHIKHNKGDDLIQDDDCIKAIEALQVTIKASKTHD
jgi:hypothetical protein